MTLALCCTAAIASSAPATQPEGDVGSEPLGVAAPGAVQAGRGRLGDSTRRFAQAASRRAPKIRRRPLAETSIGIAIAAGAPSGDFDQDGDVDLFDYAALLECVTGPGGGRIGAACGPFDFDGDNDVDLLDWGGFETVFTGASAPEGMVAIPAGEFEMGDHHDGVGNALPVHAVHVDAFLIDAHEVTNAQYAQALNWALAQGLIHVQAGLVRPNNGDVRYCDTTISTWLSRITWDEVAFGVVAGKEDHPMLRVSWYGAVAFANWRSIREGREPCYDLSSWTCDVDAGGYRLPTEAEWEYAARGGARDPYYRYPWGDAADGSNANYQGSGDPFDEDTWPETTPVGYYPANGYGLYDVAGNVWEWCNDWYDPAYYEQSPYDNPRGAATGTLRVLRGGSWNYIEGLMRCATRSKSDPAIRNYSYGLRLVRKPD